MFNYSVETGLSVQEAVDKIKEKLKGKDFGVLHDYNLKEIFISKGTEFGDYQILSVCNHKFAKEALDINLGIGAFLPCKISVYDDGRITRIVLLKPTAIISMLKDERLSSLSKTVEDILIGVIDSVK